MRKSLALFFAVLLAVFTLPLGHITANAEELVFDNIQDGEYTLKIQLLKEGTDEKSAAADYMEKYVKLLVEGEKTQLTFYIPEIEGFSFTKFEVEGAQPEVDSIKVVDEETNETVNLFTYTFDIAELKTNLTSNISYKVTIPFVFEHNDVGMDIVLLGLNELPEAEDEEEVGADVRVVGEILTEEEADHFYELNFDTDSSSTKRQLLNPVKVLEKGEDTYIQIQISDNGAPLFRSLKFNGEEVIWNSITEAPYIIQYKLTGNLEDVIDVSMVIDTRAFGGIVMPHDGIDLWLVLDDAEEGEETEEPIEGDTEEDTGEGTEEETEEEATEEQDEANLLSPDKVYEVNYTILHEDGDKPSVADSFFAKPGYILEKNGVKYFQFTITDPDYVKTFNNKYGDYLLVKENEDGSAVYQLKLDGDLSNMVLDMHIVVPQGAMPGFPGYDAEHQAILFIDSDTLKEIEDIEGFVLAGSTSADNESGPFVGTDEEEDVVEEDETVVEETDGETNPQTGVKSNILLYVLLLVGSATLLAIQLKRRTA